MVGNSIEDGLLRDIHSPAHRDRSALPVLILVGIWSVGAAILISNDFGPVMTGILGVAVCLAGLLGAVAVFVASKRDRARQAGRADEQDRKEREETSRRMIEEARSAGEFAAWEASSRE